MNHDYQTQLDQAWVGERRGEVFFSAVAEHTSDPAMKSKWTDLAELERRVGTALERLVDIQQIPVETLSMEMAGREFAAASVNESLASITEVIDTAVETYNAMRDTGPAEHATELDILARHEIALQTFVRCELAGQSDSSMDEVTQLLQELRASQS
ncbi:MAG: hypothetical protein AAF993_02370 [Pseudomonadota bacterium]